MHCLSCDKMLSDKESTRKHAVTGEFLDLCDGCLREVLSVVHIPIYGDMSNIWLESLEAREDA